MDQRRIHMVCSKKDATAIGTNVSSDKSLGGEQQFKVTLQRLTTALEAMKHKFPGATGVEYAMRMVVMPRMAYTGQGANLSDAQIKRLDKVTLAYVRKDLRLLAGFPTAPLIHHQLINHHLPNSVYYEARFGSLWRNIGRGGRPAVITQEHLERAMRTRRMDFSVAQPMRIQDMSPLNGGNYWINGLLQGLERSNLSPQRRSPHARVTHEATTTHKRGHQ